MKKVWIPNKDTVWELVDVLSTENGSSEADATLTVSAPLPAEAGGAGRLRTSEVIAKKISVPHDASHSVDAALLNDLCSIDLPHEAPLLDALHRRYRKDLIYTNIGKNVLVSINPCKQIPEVYSSIEPYLTAIGTIANTAPKPHVYTVANHALSELSQGQRTASGKIIRRNQSIIVGGESGSGKTEASKHTLQFLIEADRSFDAKKTLSSAFAALSTTSKRSNKGISALLNTANVIFEAFGNAKTLHNDNSSRFGKYMRLQYSAEHRLVSAYTETFLLEKSRLITIGANERNYHVFYALLNTANTAAGAGLKRDLQLGSAASYRILCDTTNTITLTSTEHTLEALTAALSAVGVSSEEQTEIWSVLAVLLHLGNIQCESVVGDGPQVDDNYQQVDLISPTISLSDLTFLLGVSSLTFEARVLTQRVQVGNRDSIHIKQLAAKDVAHNIHALIKFIYASLTQYLLKKVNYAHTNTTTTTTSTASSTAVVNFIGLLDVFGFEILESNSFEQLCINYTNECLQQMFCQHVFDREQEVYAAEGLEWTPIHYTTNQPVIDLIVRKPTGLLYIAEELCLLNRGQRDEDALLAAFNAAHTSGSTGSTSGGTSSSVYEKPRFGTKNLFIVNHFAGSVTYSVSGWLDKNNDALQEDLLSLLMCSSNTFIQNAIVAVGMSGDAPADATTHNTEGQLGFVPEVGADKLVPCLVDSAHKEDGDLYSVYPNAENTTSEEESAATTAAYVNNAIAMRKARTASRRASLTVGSAGGLQESASSAPIKKMASSVTVSYQFRNQLEVLLLSLQGTQPHYILCLKPNATKQSDRLERKCVLGQLRNSGVLEVVQMRQLGYPVSLSFSQFMDTYRPLLGKSSGNSGSGSKSGGSSSKEQAQQLLTAQRIPSLQYQLGKTSVFLRAAAHTALTAALSSVGVDRLRVVQALVRGVLARKLYRRRIALIVKVQARVRLFCKRAVYKRELLVVVQAKLEYNKTQKVENQNLAVYEERIVALHAAAAAGDVAKVRETLNRHPEDYFVVNWLRNNCSLLQSAVLSGSLPLIQYLKPRPEELFYPDTDGNIAVHYAARSSAADKTEILRYLGFVGEPAYLKESDAQTSKMSGYQIRPCHTTSQDPVLPRHLDPAHSDVGSGYADGVVQVRSSANSVVAKAVEADSRQAVPGATAGTVLKAGWLSKRGFKTQSMWRKRWVVLTTDALNYYHTDRDTVPRDTLTLRSKDCISVAESSVRPCALDITMAEGVGTAGKQREMISLLAESHSDMLAWINILTAVAGTDATPLRYTFVRTISPVLSEQMYCMRNAHYESPLHALCGSAEGTNKSECEKTLPATAAWLIHRGCAVNPSNLKGKSPIFLALEHGRFPLALLLLRYGATIPSHSAAKDRFLRFVGDENSPEKVISALQCGPKPTRMRNFHYLSLEILQHYIGNPGLFLDPDDSGAYFITYSVFSAAHQAIGGVQYSQCPLVRLMASPPGSSTSSRTGTDSQLLLWYNQYHLQVPLENVSDGSYIVVELSKANTGNSNAAAAPAPTTANGSHRNSVARTPAASAGSIQSLAWFTLKIDKEALNTSLLTIPFLRSPLVRSSDVKTVTTTDAHAGNMHSVAMVETTIYRRNGKEAW